MSDQQLIKYFQEQNLINNVQEFQQQINELAEQQLNNTIKTVNDQNIKFLSIHMLMNIYILCNDEKYNKEIIELIKKVSLIEVLKIKESDLLKLSCFDEKEEIEKRSQSKIDYKESKIYKCKKCKSNKVTLTQHQNRRADEAATQYLKCNDCEAAYVMH